jgi:hypothetical protein
MNRLQKASIWPGMLCYSVSICPKTFPLHLLLGHSTWPLESSLYVAYTIWAARWFYSGTLDKWGPISTFHSSTNQRLEEHTSLIKKTPLPEEPFSLQIFISVFRRSKPQLVWKQRHSCPPLLPTPSVLLEFYPTMAVITNSIMTVEHWSKILTFPQLIIKISLSGWRDLPLFLCCVISDNKRDEEKGFLMHYNSVEGTELFWKAWESPKQNKAKQNPAPSKPI